MTEEDKEPLSSEKKGAQKKGEITGSYLSEDMKRVVVIGMGYVGIPAAALFADVGKYMVTGIQRRSKRSGWKIDHINSGKNPIGGEEPGLNELIERVVLEKKTFHVTDDYSVIPNADYILIDVQTPTQADHTPRYASLKEVSRTVAEYLRESDKRPLVVIESTVAPGTTNNIVRPILEEGSGKRLGEGFHLAFAYERVMVGRLLHNIRNLPRIIGGTTEESTNICYEFYSDIINAPLHRTDALTGEVTKVIENTYRDVNIAFANEVALICESLGVDVYEVRDLVNTLPNDPSNPAANPVRNLHIPGAGVGGHCLPKDPWLLLWSLNEYGRYKFKAKVIESSRGINTYMPEHAVDLTVQALGKAGVQISESKVAVLGYAFLENSDDTRNTPAKVVIEELLGKGAKVTLHDPYVRKEEPTPVPIERDLDEVLRNTNALVIVTKHRQYYSMDLDRIASIMADPIMIDGRNVFQKELVEGRGFIYMGVGKNNC